MAVRISPASLSFPVVSSLYVNSVEFQNTTDEYVTYKIKTNVPDSYLVRPNCGIIMPGASCEIQLVLKGNDPNVKPTPKDRFMVLIQKLGTSDSATPLNQLWENVDPKSIEKQMIKCDVSGENATATSQTLESSQVSSNLFHSTVHSEIADQLKKQNEEYCAKAQKLSQMNKHLKEEKQKLQGTLQTIQQETLNIEDQLEQYKTGSRTMNGAPLLGIKGQALIALLAFILGYLLGWFLSRSTEMEVEIIPQ